MGLEVGALVSVEGMIGIYIGGSRVKTHLGTIYQFSSLSKVETLMLPIQIASIFERSVLENVKG